MIRIDKLNLSITCFRFFLIACFFNVNVIALSQKKEYSELTKSQYSEKVQQEDELFLWITMTYNQLKHDLQIAITEVNHVIKNNQPIESQSRWIFKEKAKDYQINVLCQKESSVPLVASKTSYYRDLLSGQVKEVLEYQLHYSQGVIFSFKGLGAEGLGFYNGKVERYGFKLNENRTCEIQFDEKEQIQRVIISKPRHPQEEKRPEYELYFPNDSDLNILKNKLLDRLIKASLIAATKELENNQDSKGRTFETERYIVHFDNEFRVSLYSDKQKHQEVTFYPNGHVKKFSLTLPNNKEYHALWDMQMKLIEEIR